MDTIFNQNQQSNQESIVPFDIIPLPSKGLLYPNKLETVKVEYLNATDESIFTSPNIINNNKVMDVLIKRKVKDLNGLDPLDLLLGDKVAIMMFLRVSGFGNIYKVPLPNPKDQKNPIIGEIDLSTIKPKGLGAKPDERGEFDFILPVTNKKVKFRLLNGRDDISIEAKDEHLSKSDPDKLSYKSTLRLQHMIMEIDGNRDKMFIDDYLKKIPLGDSLELKKYYSTIEPGLDLNVEVRIPGGGSFNTFLPMGDDFFGI